MAIDPFEHSFASLIVVMTTHVGPSNPRAAYRPQCDRHLFQLGICAMGCPIYCLHTRRIHCVLWYNTNLLEPMDQCVEPPTDLSVTNATYASNITGLEANCAHYFYINSINSYGGILTMIMNFTTLEAGKSYY